MNSHTLENPDVSEHIALMLDFRAPFQQPKEKNI